MVLLARENVCACWVAREENDLESPLYMNFIIATFVNAPLDPLTDSHESTGTALGSRRSGAPLAARSATAAAATAPRAAGQPQPLSKAVRRQPGRQSPCGANAGRGALSGEKRRRFAKRNAGWPGSSVGV